MCPPRSGSSRTRGGGAALRWPSSCGPTSRSRSSPAASPRPTETGQIVASALGVPFAAAEGLHEHDRSNVGWSSSEDFAAAVAAFFARPSELVMGRETADAARERFAQAVDRVLAAHPTGNLAIVAHGTVITLLVAAHNQIEPFPLWKSLDPPSFVALTLPGMALADHRPPTADD